ncbi:MAG: TMEM43 family protein [Myxococcales bacterium]|nr:TMEM43 family protein [Myxococcota bacterium]MDW8281151.1 TMEM43 family protein [Myxococcales bacterium]
MPDQFTEVSEQGFGANLMDSIKGVAVGAILFVLSFPLLWWNEGRPDLSRLASSAQIVRPEQVDRSAEGKLISLTGELRADGTLDDPEFLRPGPWLRLERGVEMYAWIEHKQTKTDKKLGGGRRTETTYTYETDWTDAPQPSSSFRHPEGHENPSLPFQSKTFFAPVAFIGAYRFDPSKPGLPAGEPVELTPDKIKVSLSGAGAAASAAGSRERARFTDRDHMVDGSDEALPAPDRRQRRSGNLRGRPGTGPEAEDTGAAMAASAGQQGPLAWQLAGTYLFLGKGTPEHPVVGDVRVSFRALSPGLRVTLFGQLSGDQVVAHTTKHGDTFFRVLQGEHQEAVQRLATEHKMVTWVLRVVGWLMMWFGLMMFFGPINAVLDIIPFLGSAGRFLVGLVMLPVSLLMSTVVILVSIIAHNVILLVLTLGVLGAGGFFLYRRRQVRRAAT